MTDITESECAIHTNELDEWNPRDTATIHIECRDEVDAQVKLKQILQNTQELARIKGDLKHCYKRYQEQLDITIQFRQDKEKLQSQHKKLVDAIQNLVGHYQKEIERLQPHEEQYQDRASHSGLLDMSDQVDKMWHDEYCYKKEILNELQKIIEESKCN